MRIRTITIRNKLRASGVKLPMPWRDALQIPGIGGKTLIELAKIGYVTATDYETKGLSTPAMKRLAKIGDFFTLTKKQVAHALRNGFLDDDVSNPANEIRKFVGMKPKLKKGIFCPHCQKRIKKLVFKRVS